MLTEPMTPVLLRMTGPMILGIIAILAFNLVDTFFIGMLGTQALAAISFTFPVTFVVTSLAMGLGAGLSAVIGHALGQGKHDEATRITTDCLFLAVVRHDSHGVQRHFALAVVQVRSVGTRAR